MRNALAGTLLDLGGKLCGAGELVEGMACMREALALSEATDDVNLKQAVLANLANMSCSPDQPVGPAEAAALRCRLNALYAQNGRTPDTSCTICLEPLETLEQPGGGIGEGAIADGGRSGGSATDWSVNVLECGHQFLYGCLCTWRRTTSNMVCPICKA